MNKWCQEAGDGVVISYEQKDKHIKPSTVDDSNPFWVAFKRAVVDEMWVILSIL